MKGIMSRMWRSGLSLLLVLCLVVGMCPAAFATGTEETKQYVSLGDSMANGYGLTGYGNVNGYLEESPDAYPAKVAQNYGWELTQLAMSAMRAEDLHYILEYPNGYQGDYYTQDEFIDNRFEDDCGGVTKAAEEYQNAVANADVISLGIGNANFGVFMLGRITNALGVLGGNAEEDSWIALETALSECDAQTKAFVLKVYDQLKAELTGRVSADAQEVVEPLVNAIVYTLTSYVLNYGGVIEAIVNLNDDAEIIIVGLMNTFYGMEVSYEGETIDLGAIMDSMISMVNAYLAALPATLQAAGKYPNATFYFAEASNVSMIVETYADQINGNNVVRDRTIEEVVDMVWPMLNSMTEAAGDGSYIEINRKDVEAYEAALAGGAEKFAQYLSQNLESGKLQPIATYLAFEKATISASKLDVLDANAFITLANGLDGVFDGVYDAFKSNLTANTEENAKHTAFAGEVDTYLKGNDAYTSTVYTLVALPDAMSAALTEDETVYSLLNLFARMLIGNGIGCHPSAAGHDTLTAAIVEAYGSGHTVKDETIENVEITLDALYNLVQEYSPEALEQAYAYAVENGYIDQLNAAIDELKGDLEAKIDEYVTTAKPAIEGSIAKLEEEVAALEEELASLKAELEAKKEELANAAGATAEELEKAVKELEDVIATIESTIAAVESKIADLEAVIDELETALANIETELAELGEAVTSLEDACTALMDVLANASGSSVEAVLSALDAARNVAEAAIETVETIYAQAETLYNDLTALAEELGEKALDLYAYVTEQLQAAYDKLPEDVKQGIEEATAALKEAAEQAKAEILAEAEKKIEELKAELQPELEKLQAELNAIKEQIEAEVAAKAAELEAAAQAKIDELTAAANEKIAELEKQLAEKQAELENAAEELKAEIQAEIDAIQAQIDAIKGDLEAAVEAVKAELEQKIAEIRAEVEQAYAEAVAELEQKIADLTAELEQKIAEIQAAAQAKIDEITAELEKQLAELGEVGEDIQAAIDLIKEAAKGEIAAAIEEAKAILGNAVEGADNLAELVENLVNETTTAIENKITEIVDAYNAAYDAATTDDYVITEESYYVALGDGSAVSQSYVDKVAEQLGVDYTNLAKEGSVDDAIGIIEANADTIAKADLITVGYGNAAYTQSAIEQMINALRGKETVDYDWEAYVGADGAAYVEQALDTIYEELVTNGLDTTISVAGLNNVSLATALTMAVETYAYGTVAYACDLPDVVNAIHEVNPDAVVIIVGMNNPFEGTTIEYEGATIDIGEYVGYLVDAANVHGTAYAMLTGNAIYVEAPSAQTAVSGRNLNAEAFIMEYLFDNVSFEPTDNGHVYIANQILDALNVSKIEVEEKGLWGDADSNGVVNLRDALLILQYVNKKKTPDEIDLTVCDVDGLHDVNLRDALIVLQYCNKKFEKFPVEM